MAEVTNNQSEDITPAAAVSSTTAAEWDDALLFEVAIDPFQQIAISGREEGKAAGLHDGYNEGMNIGRTKGWEIGLELGYIHEFAKDILDGYNAEEIISGGNGAGGEQRQIQDALNDVSQEIQIQHHQPHHTAHRTISHRLDRCLTLARDLVDMISKFPDPDTLLSQKNYGDRLVHDVLESSSMSKESTEKKVPSLSPKEECSNNDNGRCTEETNTNCSNITPHDKHPEVANIKEAAAARTTAIDTNTNQKAMLDISTSLERIRAKFKLLCVLLKTKQSYDLKTVLELGDKMQLGTNIIDVDGKTASGMHESISKNDETNLSRTITDIIDTQKGKDMIALESDW